MSIAKLAVAAAFPVSGLGPGIALIKESSIQGFKPSFYTQVQWRNVQSSSNDGYGIQTARLGLAYSPPGATSGKVSVELVSGGDELEPELKDLSITHKVAPRTSIDAGQMLVQLGNEIARSSSIREMPQASLYNRRLFPGERDRGVQVRHMFGSGWLVHAGVWTGLAVKDPQFHQSRPPGFTFGARWEAEGQSFGVSALVGRRPSLGAVVHEANRFLVYLDGACQLSKGLAARAELVTGRDRDPLGGESPTFAKETTVLGYHLQLSYSATPSSQFTLKYENYDPDVGDKVSMNRATSQVGVAYTHHFSKNLKLTLAWEHPNEEGVEKHNDIVTIRSQYKL